MQTTKTLTLDKVLSSPWLEDNFSGRIWENRDKLIRELKQTLSRGIVRGDSLDEMTKALAKQMDTAESRAATLVHTESAHIAAEASLAGYKETGVQRYTFDATLDSKTCSYCGQMDQLQFPLSEQETGVNYPPLHPHCRCTTLPVTGFQIGSKRAARNPETGKIEYVKKGLTYEEWHKKYIENDPENAILELNKRETSALQKYISADSYPLNNKLRCGEALNKAEQRWTERLDKALDKLPVYEGTVYRSLSSDMIPDKDAFLTAHEADAIVTYSAYTSTSTEVYDPDMDIQLVIQSKTGRDMRGINKSEKEILFKRCSTFAVKRRKGNTIWLTEL